MERYDDIIEVVKKGENNEERDYIIEDKVPEDKFVSTGYVASILNEHGYDISRDMVRNRIRDFDELLRVRYSKPERKGTTKLYVDDIRALEILLNAVNAGQSVEDVKKNMGANMGSLSMLIDEEFKDKMSNVLQVVAGNIVSQAVTEIELATEKMESKVNAALVDREQMQNAGAEELTKEIREMKELLLKQQEIMKEQEEKIQNLSENRKKSIFGIFRK